MMRDRIESRPIVDTTIIQRKRELRREVKARRAALSPDERRVRSERAASALMASQPWRQARTVALFYSMGDEIDTLPLVRSLWRSGTAVALPVTPSLGLPLELRWATEETEMILSRHGALEPGPDAAPVEPSSLDLLVVPGLAFDARGARLGYGGGYYDRTLVDAGPAILFCFACQEVDHVPEEAHDHRVDGVVTELGLVRPA